jgi:hypothetical protein
MARDVVRERARIDEANMVGIGGGIVQGVKQRPGERTVLPRLVLQRSLATARRRENCHVRGGQLAAQGYRIHGLGGPVQRRRARMAGIEQEQHAAVLGELEQLASEHIDTSTDSALVLMPPPAEYLPAANSVRPYTGDLSTP